MSFEETFNSFCSKGTEATTKDINKWFTDAKCFTKPSCSSNSLDIAFSKCKDKKKKTINFKEFKCVVEEMAKNYAKDKKISIEDAVSKMSEKLTGATKQLKGTKQTNSGITKRMTDTNNYTGAHKERFDKDGKGKGIEGRENVVDDTGYVGNYKGDKSYDKAHE
ncbi:hypothetical protein A3Q56_00345 [Intoshia linei]|uniref:Uncharacterized protein n=1 Tax=Intoshia linei TaxID=1819745 RepID=A0A177BC28_9BILA|nr:hypothetical protein A3Q56_00345 [Intoshia linei]